MGYHVVALSSGDSKKALALELGAHDYLDGSKVDQAAELQKMGGAKVILGTYIISSSCHCHHTERTGVYSVLPPSLHSADWTKK